MDKQKGELTSYLGIFRKKISLFEAVALISSATIGAGILGIPFAISKVGIPIGIAYIVAIGLFMVGINQLVGEIILRTKGDHQLVGLAKRYLGTTGGILMGVFTYSILFGALVVYIIGVGESLRAVLGGSKFAWSLGFFAIGITVIYIGLRTLKKVEILLSLGILTVVVVIAAFSMPNIDVSHLTYHNFSDLLLPYGVLLFAFHGTTSVPEAQRLLKDKDHKFKHAIIYSGLASIIVYLIFSLVVVGVTGAETTEIATIGLGEAIGPIATVLGNLFAVLAMGTSFLIIGLSLKDSLSWDFDFTEKTSTFLVGLVPLSIFLLGLREFITAIDMVGGIFMSLEMALLVIIYWRAKQDGTLEPGRYNLHHTILFCAVALVAFAIGTVYSLMKIL
ncbi:MAG: aromatic amino acid transport family protein [Candidatus Magasanikbacteria bacterium]